MARRNRQPQQPAQRRSVTAPLAGRPKSQSGGDPMQRPGRVKRVRLFGGEVKGELAKTEFPDRHQTVQSTGVVLAACIIVGAYLYGLDQIFARFVQQLVELQN